MKAIIRTGSKGAILSLILILILFTSQGCVSFFASGRQSVSFKTKENDAKMFVDNEELKGKSDKIKIDRDRAFHNLRLEKEGYKTYNIVFRPSKIDGIYWLNIPFFITGGFFWDFGGRKIYKYLPVYHAKFEKSLELPKRKEEEKYIVLTNTDIKIKEGVDIIHEYGDASNFESEMYKTKRSKAKKRKSDEELEIKNSTLSYDLNSLLVKYGYYDTTGKLFVNRNNSIQITAEIVDYTFIVYDNTFSYFKTIGVELEIEWKLLDYYDAPLYSTTMMKRSDYYTYNYKGLNFSTIIIDALEYHLMALLKEDEVKKHLKIDRDSEKKEMDSWEWINIPLGSQHGSSMNDFIKAGVTIKNKNRHGSGFVISDQGHIVTNHHVVKQADTVSVIFHDGTRKTGKILRKNGTADLALIKVEANNLVSLKINQAENIDLGMDVYCIGTPEDIELGQSLSKGIISGSRKGEAITYLQTDVSINSGNSGGPLINRAGEVHGVVNAKLRGLGVEGIGFAIPSYEIYKRLKLKEN